MHQGPDQTIHILSPAKINLFLRVIGKRPDGYHELETLMCRISLYDQITLRFAGERISVQCNLPEVPENETNLAYKAARLFMEECNTSAGVVISIDKTIPVGAGLGGGSSNAAAVLSALNRHFKYPFSEKQLMIMGGRIGADIPFFIFQKPALATGIGERLRHFSGLFPYHVLLIDPRIHVSTAEVYNNLNLGLTKSEKKLKDSAANKDEFDVASHLRNDLETVTERWHSDIGAAKQALLNHGAKGALMSGSGSAVFGLFSGEKELQRAHDHLSGNKRWRFFIAKLIV